MWDLGLGHCLCAHATLLQIILRLWPNPGECLFGLLGVDEWGDLRLVASLGKVEL